MKTWQTQRYLIGGFQVEIHYESESLYDYFNVALAHLQSERGSQVNFEIFARDHQKLPQPFWDWSNIDNQGNLADSGRVSINYENWTGMLRLFDPIEGVGVFWIRELASIPIWHRSFPFRTLLTRFFEHTSIQPVHSAAVALQGKALLLAGASGSGKSSTALASLLNGLDFLGDDFNLVDVDSLIIHSLYGIAKLEKHQLQEFPSLRKLPGIGDDDKDQIEVARHFPDKTARKAQLKAVIFPKIGGANTSSITAIPAQRALQEMSRSTLELLPGNRVSHFHKLGKICRTLPCYSLTLSADYEEIVDTLRNFLKNEK